MLPIASLIQLWKGDMSLLHPLESYMKLGIVHFMAFPFAASGEGEIAESVRKIAYDDAFEAIEITRVKDPAERRRVAKVLEQSRLAAGFGAQTVQLTEGLDINHADESERKKAVSRMKELVVEAAEMGIDKFALLSGKDPGPDGREAATQRLIASLEEICDHAAEQGSSIILETFDRTIDKCALIGPSAEAAAVARQVRERYDNFGLMLDLSHLPLQEETSAEALANVQGLLVHAHIGNCVLQPDHPLYGDHHPSFGAEGGEVDVPELTEYMEQLLRTEYLVPNPAERPVVAFEVKPHGDEQPELVIAHAKRTLREAWARVQHVQD